MKILFFFPARSGSKGVPNKNIRPLAGKPLMTYAIDAVKQSKVYTQHECLLFLSTDSSFYAEIGARYGTETPFLRPKSLSTDQSPIEDTYKHTFDYFKNDSFDLFCCIQVTSPFIIPDDIDLAVSSIINDKAASSYISVCESEVMPLWCNTLDASKNMDNFVPDTIRKKNRQELPVYYRITGMLRICKWKKFEQNGFDWYKSGKAIVFPQERSLDIDTELDFQYAEFLMERKSSHA